MRTCIKNGHIVTHDNIFKASLVIENGKIIEMTSSEDIVADEVIDAKSNYILPGCVDMHTKLALGAEENEEIPSAKTFKQNSLSALFGGTTTVIEETLINNDKSSHENLLYYQEILKSNSYTDYSLHQNFTPNFTEHDLETACNLTTNGFPSCTLSTVGINSLSDEQLLEILKKLTIHGASSLIHPESSAPIKALEELHTLKKQLSPYALATTRPSWTESEVVLRMSNLSRAAGLAFVLNPISTKDSVKLLHSQVNEGLPITVTTCPHYLVFTDDKYLTNNPNDENIYQYCVTPPLRKKEDVSALWRGIQDGLIHFITSGHSSISLKHKIRKAKEDIFTAPMGIPGIELRLPLLYTHGVMENKISIMKMVEITATHVTRIAGLRSKGRIEAGVDADIIIFDANHQKTITKEDLHDSSDYSPYLGMSLQGFPKDVFLRGTRVIEDFKLKKQECQGELIFRKAVAMR